MKIEDFTHLSQVHTEADLDAILTVRDHRNSNCFWLSLEDQVYPYLSISIRDELAYAHYFPDEGHPGLHTISNNEHKVSDARYEFFIYTHDETIEVMGANLISVPDALLVAREFLKTRALPTCVKWFEL